MQRILLALISLGLAHAAQAQIPAPCANGAVTPADNCANACIACDLQGYSGQTSGFTAGTAPGFCGSVSAEQWIGFTAMANNATITLQPNNCINGNGLAAAIYQTCNGAPIVCNGGQAGGGNLPINLSANFTPGQTYFLMVDGYQGDACQFQISANPSGATAVQPVGATPPLQGPWVVSPNSSIVYNVPAVANAGYYTWSAPPGALINGQPSPLQIPGPNGHQVTITFGFEDPLSGAVCVTPGNTCSTGTAACHNVLVSSTFLPATCPGNFDFAADECYDACVFCNFNGFSGSTSGYTPSNSVPGFCGTIENDQWFGFIAGATAVTFTATPSNCTNGNGIQIALIGACGEAPINCNGGAETFGDTPVSISPTGLIPGENYFLLIDGFAGDQCDFTLTAIPPSAVQAPNVGVTGAIQGPFQTCPGATVNYAVPAVTGAGAYVWTAPPGSYINGFEPPAYLQGADGNQVQITFGSTGGQVCVTAINACDQNNASVCKNITIVPIPPTTLPPITVCAEEVPYELPWGDLAVTTGLYQTVYTSWLGCDSVVRQLVIIKSPIHTFLPTKYLCPGNCTTVCGVEYCESGAYTEVCTSYQGCDSLISFTVVRLEPNADILGGSNILSCTNPCITLSSAPSNGTKIWKNIAGQVLGTGNTFTVCTPGTYTLTNTVTGGGVNCAEQDTIVIQGDMTAPAVSAAGGALSCSSISVTLDGSTNIPNALFSWSGPNNFTSNLEDPNVQAPGIYTLTVTNPVNGCTNSAGTTVTSTPDLPDVSVAGGMLNCTITATTIYCTTNVDPAAFSWEGPGGFISAAQNPMVSEPGIYTVTVTNPADGCSNIATTTVGSNINPPSVVASGDTVNCYHPSGMFSVHATTSASQASYAWAGPGGFTASEQNPQVSELGDYFVTVTDMTNGCTSSAMTSFLMDVNVPLAEATGGLLTCNVTSLLLQCLTSANNASFLWTGPGGFSSTEQYPLVSEPGSYSVTVTDLSNGCSSSDIAEVYADILQPVIVLGSSATLTCSNPATFINWLSLNKNSMFEWTGPGGFTSTAQSPLVSEPGTYTVTVTFPTNGCTASASTEINADFATPGASAEGGILTCSAPAVTLHGSSPTQGVTFTWMGPGIISPEPNPMVNVPGTYILTVKAPNGCTSSAAVSVLQDITPPTLSVELVVNDHNGQGIGSINISTDAEQIIWTLNGTPVGMSEDLSGLFAGAYHVVVVGGNGCTRALDVVVQNTVATQEAVNASDWKIFPNPTDRLLFADLSAWDGQEIWMQVFNSQGQRIQMNTLVATKTPQAVPLPEQAAAGLYSLEIRLENGEKRAKRFVISR